MRTAEQQFFWYSGDCRFCFQGLSFLRFIFIYLDVCVHVYATRMQVSTKARKGFKPLELELQVVESCVGTKHGSSGTAERYDRSCLPSSLQNFQPPFRFHSSFGFTFLLLIRGVVCSCFSRSLWFSAGYLKSLYVWHRHLLLFCMS